MLSRLALCGVHMDKSLLRHTNVRAQPYLSNAKFNPNTFLSHCSMSKFYSGPKERNIKKLQRASIRIFRVEFDSSLTSFLVKGNEAARWPQRQRSERGCT